MKYMKYTPTVSHQFFCEKSLKSDLCVCVCFKLPLRKEVPGKFSIDVSVAPGERLSFKLSFEQLLVRRLGRYELALGLRPTQPVPNLTVEVSITERTGISFVRVLPLRTGQHLSNTLGGGFSFLSFICSRFSDMMQYCGAWMHCRSHISCSCEVRFVDQLHFNIKM